MNNRKTKKNKTKKRNLVFNANDYASNDGMLTTVWGPPMWHYLHTMSFNYPVNPSNKDKKYYKEFILNLKNVLPCGKCRENLKRNLKTLPITNRVMKNRHTFSKYVFDLHELINKMLNKKSGLTYNKVRDRYEHFRSRCTQKKIKIKDNGCTEPLTGEKSKCIIKIVPKSMQCNTFQMDKMCEKVKINF